MKFLYLADTHLRTATPSCRLDRDFYVTQLAKLKHVVGLSNQLGIDYVVHGGDLFDTHDPTSRLLHDTMAILNTCDARWLVNPGNHDIFGANTATLNRSGLGLLWQAGLIETFSQQEDMELGDIVIRFLPYSLNYKEEDYHFEPKDGTKVYIVVTHAMLTTHFVPYPHTLITDLKTNADMVLCAHWHGQFTQKIRTTYFMNSGPLTRQTTFEARLQPSVGCIEILPSKKGPWSEITVFGLKSIPCAPPEDVIDFSRLDLPDQTGLAEQFLHTLRFSSLETLDRQKLVREVGEKNGFESPVVEHSLTRLSTIEKTLELAQ